jgi:hypothetical protein
MLDAVLLGSAGVLISTQAKRGLKALLGGCFGSDRPFQMLLNIKTSGNGYS